MKCGQKFANGFRREGGSHYGWKSALTESHVSCRWMWSPSPSHLGESKSKEPSRMQMMGLPRSMAYCIDWLQTHTRSLWKIS